MAQFPPAFDFMIPHECPALDWKPEPDNCPEGCTGPCFQIGGINSGFYKAAYSRILAVAADQRKPLIMAFYLDNFWTRMALGGIVSQDLANRVFDEGVNAGPRTAVRLLQQALNLAFRWDVNVDGELGPDTLTAVNDADAEKLVAAYRQLRVEHYEEIVKLRPEDVKYLAGWLARASG